MQASIKQGFDIGLDTVADIERHRLNSRGWVDRPRRRKGRTIDNKQVLHIVAAASGVHHGCRGIIAHAARTHLMPTSTPPDLVVAFG